MNPFDKIIGYDAVKNELIRMADVLAHSEVYSALGVSVPRGLLLHGDPGVGKTLMVNSLIEASGLPSFTCRRNIPDGDFVLRINEVFDEASKKAPAIVFLDDLDKFAKSEVDSFNQEEFVAVQAAIDNLNGKQVFVVATANDIDFLPPSLVRPGRFDKTLRIHNPSGQEAVEIIQHYLSGKPLEDDIDVSYIAKLLQNQSCAVLETAVNAAGVLAGFDRANRISMHHFVLGCLETVHEIPASMVIKGKMNVDNEGCIKIDPSISYYIWISGLEIRVSADYLWQRIKQNLLAPGEHFSCQVKRFYEPRIIGFMLEFHIVADLGVDILLPILPGGAWFVHRKRFPFLRQRW